MIRSAGSGCSPRARGGLSITRHDGRWCAWASGAPGWVPPHFSRGDCWTIPPRRAAYCRRQSAASECMHHPAIRSGNLVCTPLYVDGALLGVLHTADGGGGAPRDEDPAPAHRDLRRGSSSWACPACACASLRGRASCAMRSPACQTGSSSTRRCRASWRDPSRSGHALTLASIDVDKFKRFNVPRGTMCRRPGVALDGEHVDTASARGHGRRYGGDEFLLPAGGHVGRGGTGALRAPDGQANSDLDPELGALRRPRRLHRRAGQRADFATDTAALLRAKRMRRFVCGQGRGGHASRWRCLGPWWRIAVGH